MVASAVAVVAAAICAAVYLPGVKGWLVGEQPEEAAAEAEEGEDEVELQQRPPDPAVAATTPFASAAADPNALLLSDEEGEAEAQPSAQTEEQGLLASGLFKLLTPVGKVKGVGG